VEITTVNKTHKLCYILMNCLNVTAHTKASYLQEVSVSPIRESDTTGANSLNCITLHIPPISISFQYWFTY